MPSQQLNIRHERNRQRHLNRGLTLVEVLIALTMTLIVLGAMMVAFRYASAEISKGRAMMELSNQLRMVQETLRADLEGVTVDTRPWAITSAPLGYLTYIEGPISDRTTAAIPADRIFGDLDDYLAMTVRAHGREFRGRAPGGDTSSQVAEVIWWANFENRPGSPAGLQYDESLRVYRRALMILPNLAPFPVGEESGGSLTAVADFFRRFDVSMRWVDTNNDGSRDTLVANSLEDLAKRENRFAHIGNVFPHLMDRTFLETCQQSNANLTGFDLRFAGSDVMLADALAFDVQVFSPDAPVQVNVNGGLALTPGDPGYNWALPPADLAQPTVDRGAFVDLGYTGQAFDLTLPEFSTLPQPRSQLLIPPTLDTFSPHYESNGRDEDGDGLIDEGTNGLDDDNANGVDDNGERETLPPYPFRISGLRVTFRIVERSTQQIRQTSVSHSFLPR